MKKAISPEYLELAKKLKKEEAEKLLSRMTGKLPRRLAHDELSREEALAIQLELEEERLNDWRSMMQMLKDEEAKKLAKEKAKALEQVAKAKAKAAEKDAKVKAEAAKKEAKVKAEAAKQEAKLKAKAEAQASKENAKSAKQQAKAAKKGAEKVKSASPKAATTK